MTISLDELPLEVLLKILEYSNITDILLNFQFVSKNFRITGTGNALWNQLINEKWKGFDDQIQEVPRQLYEKYIPKFFQGYKFSGIIRYWEVLNIMQDLSKDEIDDNENKFEDISTYKLFFQSLKFLAEGVKARDRYGMMYDDGTYTKINLQKFCSSILCICLVILCPVLLIVVFGILLKELYERRQPRPPNGVQFL